MKSKSTAPPPTALEGHLGFWLRFVSNHVSLRFRQQLEHQGVTVAEWVALRTLWEQPETRHADLILALGMTKGATSKIVSRLESKGLAERLGASGPGREQAVALTQAGRALVPRLATLADANDAHFFGHLSTTEREQLREALRALVLHHGLQRVPAE